MLWIITLLQKKLKNREHIAFLLCVFTIYERIYNIYPC